MRANLDDLAVLDTDISGKDIGRSRHRAVGDDEIESLHYVLVIWDREKRVSA